jgi:uncharacterized repeat protein (TIGR04076 family)
MSFEMPKCRITVLKRTLNQDLIDDPYGVPEDFSGRCVWAWADIRKDIMTVAMGANMPGIKQPGTVITGCTDWLRPVIFKVERVEND